MQHLAALQHADSGCKAVTPGSLIAVDIPCAPYMELKEGWHGESAQFSMCVPMLVMLWNLLQAAASYHRVWLDT